MLLRMCQISVRSLLPLLLLAVLVSCTRPAPELPPPVAPPPKVEIPPPPPAPPAVRANWDEMPGWQEDDLSQALAVFLKGCSALRWRPGWQDACSAGGALDAGNPSVVRDFFQEYFQPWKMQQEDGSATGLMTGYYVPDLPASRERSEKFRYPVYGVPDDLLVVDLSDVYPELGNYRLRGRLEGRRVIPYWSRSEIDAQRELDGAKILFWVEDPVDLFYLHIQGSGSMVLEDGHRVMVNYADQNGHPYRSIGRILLDMGAMTRDQMSMQNIKKWVQDNPQQADGLLGENPSYVFFRELPAEFHSPPGAFGIPLTAERSLAVDPRYIPLGAPVFLAATWPGQDQPLQRLMVAQDTGGAIKGPVRADFFWGLGDQAGEWAGRTKQKLQLWMLLPSGVEPPAVGPKAAR